MLLMTLEAILYILAFIILYYIFLLLKKWLSTEIEIDITPDIIHFRSNSKNLSLKPVLYISKNGKTQKILGICELRDESIPSEKIHLFKDRLISQHLYQKRHCFEAFFRCGFEQLLNRKLFLFANVKLKGFDNFKIVFKEGHKKELCNVLEMAGAVECHFL